MPMSLPDSQEQSGVPFSFFCSLVREISRVQPCSTRTRLKDRKKTTALEYPTLQVFRQWVAELHRRFSPLPPNTTSICFRLLFPEDDIRRKYDIQEARMTQLLADSFGVDAKIFQKWGLEEASGCLGQELKVVLERTCSAEDGYIGPLSIAEVDELLDELGSKSGYSHKSLRVKYPKGKSRTRATILRNLFRPLSPDDASILTQIILKDLTPLLYPLTEFHYSTALIDFNTASIKVLVKEHAMDAWDPSGSMRRFYRMRSDTDEAAAFADEPSNSKRKISPKLGSFITIPKSEKGQGCIKALGFFKDCDIVWAETKYDGERAQIHVEMRADGSPHITIFSKSKRDSTYDRHAIHSIILAALGLSQTDTISQASMGLQTLKVNQNVILDAEMVAFRGNKIEELWHIRRLVETTAHGVRGRRRSHLVVPDDDMLESMQNDADEDLHLGLVLFDILVLDSETLLFQPYSRRREILEALIIEKPGQAILADRWVVNMSLPQPHQILDKIFSDHIKACQEGLVLKAANSWYNEYRKPWVKLKKDYIPGHGDALDLVIIGASWEKVRGRSLRVPPTTFTTFYIGAVNNLKATQLNPRVLPHFHVYFTTSYGLTRERLEELNFFIKSSEPMLYSSLDIHKSNLPYTFSVHKGLNPPPTVILRTPLLAEIFGAGFSKAPRSKHYELRFPRFTKVYWPTQRHWTEGVDLEELHTIACKSVGRDLIDKDSDLQDWTAELFQRYASSSANCTLKRKAVSDVWDENSVPSGSAKPEHEPSAGTSPKPHRTNTSGLAAPLAPPTLTDVSNVLLPMSPPRSPCKPKASKRMKYLPSSASSLIDGQILEGSHSIRFLMTPPPEASQSSTMCWFAQSANGGSRSCPNWAKWKKLIPRTQRLHSLDSLLLGCGWTADVAQTEIERGIIVLELCAEAGSQWKGPVLETLLKMQTNARLNRAPILVFGCRSGEEPMFRFT
ncbi:hypothetical protein B0H34DRAFT_704613 [Crassisporium funariophilum]|nr:hypothetical protein B0H34DRAFT_704613 [Crassisporium funariophilum]